MTDKYIFAILVVAITIFSSGCDTVPAPKKIIGITPITTPALMPSAEPNISTSIGNGAVLSWIENDTTNSVHTLRFSKWENGKWSEAGNIAHGDDWFVNWADFPAIAIQSDGRLLASWLKKSGASTYAYDVILAQSDNSGELWSDVFSPHDDNTASEHGFVSMQPLSSGEFAVAWLDGRLTIDKGPMNLRFATIDAESNVLSEVILDDRVCDCCQTSMTIAGDGSILVAYRDRSEEEIRDMSIVRYGDSAWSTPLSIFNDGWKIDGCPVNGPSIASSNSLVAAVWFTMGSDSTARVLCSFSRDFGISFESPFQIDTGDPLGRVDIIFTDDNNAIVSWLETVNNKTRIAVCMINPEGILSDIITVTETEASRLSGFARMGLVNDGVIIAWTDLTDSPVVKSALITLQ